MQSIVDTTNTSDTVCFILNKRLGHEGKGGKEGSLY